MQKQVLYLRYGSDYVTSQPKPRVLLSLATIARLLKITVSQAAHLDRLNFEPQTTVRRSLRPPTMGTRPGEGYGTMVSEANVTHEELDYLFGDDQIREWAPLSLPERCVRFHRRFPDRLLKPWTLSLLMRKAGFKKKRVCVNKAAQRATQRMEEFDKKLVELATKVDAVQKAGEHLVFADESIFTSRDFQMKAWSAPGQNVRVEDRTGLQPALAVCAAVCSCHGLLAIAIEEKSFDHKKFKRFLEEVRSAAGSGTVHLFLDNCRVHHAKDLRETWGQLDIKPIWNVAYSP